MARKKKPSGPPVRRKRIVRPAPAPPQAESYKHPTAESLLRPDVGTQPQFRKKKPPVTYSYDSSLSPAMDWDGQNPAREEGEAALAEITKQTAALKAAKDDSQRQAALAAIEAAAQKLGALSKPFLNWSGKAERISFDVPTLPLFVHERLSTQAIIQTLKGHKRDKQFSMFEMFADPGHSVADQVLRAYEYADKWVNRMILGDSLVVMSSLLHYENLGGQVQMIYMDPPYGVKFGSNFQPFVRKRDVKHNDDEDMTREPEMVQAYRDTWEVGLHSYLTYMRDRLLLARDLLAPSGSIFVQISDENVHHLRELMDEVYGTESFMAEILFKKTAYESSADMPVVADYILWYCKDRERRFYQPLLLPRSKDDLPVNYDFIRQPDGTHRKMTREEREDPSSLPRGTRIYRRDNLTSAEFRTNTTFAYVFEGRSYHPGNDKHWSTTKEGLDRLAESGRLEAYGNTLSYRRFLDDAGGTPLANMWTDTAVGGYTEPKSYVVQTNLKAIERCLLMATRPGDLVLDPTCGSGTTAYAAEQW
ncbi:MAG: DNA methyltransferase, partial [Planctomycetota bacterium]